MPTRSNPNDLIAPGVIFFDHPLIQHKVAKLRDRDTTFGTFRDMMAQVAGLMVYEATRTLPTEPQQVQTPLETVTCHKLSNPITVVPVLRAGLGMADGILDLLPEARVGHLGLVRDEHTLEPSVYLNRLPADLGDGPVMLVDPMLATGGSAIAAAKILRETGATDLRMICLVAAPEGVANVREFDPNIPIYAAAMDRELDENGYIRPGLGDAGDRLFGTG